MFVALRLLSSLIDFYMRAGTRRVMVLIFALGCDGDLRSRPVGKCWDAWFACFVDDRA